MTNNFSEAGYNNPSLVVESANAGTVVYPPGGNSSKNSAGSPVGHAHTGSMEIDIDGIVRIIPAGHVTLLKPSHRENFYFAKDHDTWHRWIAILLKLLV